MSCSASGHCSTPMTAPDGQIQAPPPARPDPEDPGAPGDGQHLVRTRWKWSGGACRETPRVRTTERRCESVKPVGRGESVWKGHIERYNSLEVSGSASCAG